MDAKKEPMNKSRPSLASSVIASSAGATLLGSVFGSTGAVVGAIAGAAAGVLLWSSSNHHIPSRKGQLPSTKAGSS